MKRFVLVRRQIPKSLPVRGVPFSVVLESFDNPYIFGIMAEIDKSYSVTLAKDSIEIETPTEKLLIKSEVRIQLFFPGCGCLTFHFCCQT